MKQLQIFKTEPDGTTLFLAEKLAEGKEVIRVDLYEKPNYDRLVALIAEHEEIVSWW